ncbi:MAG: alpha/beta hydrolase [Pseudomonadales bacterium]|nr:alpha/beta hydrolase [Pseudomonadales bacterium]MBL6817210.1 alpha/beta hydrolase [Pseudomonadales bacterium]
MTQRTPECKPQQIDSVIIPESVYLASIMHTPIKTLNFLLFNILITNTAWSQLPELPVSATLSGDITEAKFFAGASMDSENFLRCVSPEDRFSINGAINVQSNHVGNQGKVFVVATLGKESYMLVGDTFVAWDYLNSSLQPAYSAVLQAEESFAILADIQLTQSDILSGELAVYLGYESALVPDEIYFSSVPLRVSIIPGAVQSLTSYQGIDPCSRYKTQISEGLVYGTGLINSPQMTEVNLLLDLYKPDVELNDQTLPLMVIIHGGGFKGGTRTKEELKEFGEAFAKQGYLAVSIDYRVGPQTPTLNAQFQAIFDSNTVPPGEDPDQFLGMLSALEDTIKAIEWTQSTVAASNATISGIGMLGSSAGAITALNYEYTLDNFGIDVPDMQVVVGFWGSLALAAGDFSVMTADEAPVIMIHGTEDPTVIYETGSLAIANRATEIGLSHELIVSEGAGHGFAVNKLDSSESFPGSGFTKRQRVLDFVNAAMLQPDCVRSSSSIDPCK